MVTNLIKKDTNEKASTEENNSDPVVAHEEENEKSSRKRKKKYRTRKFPIWLRIIVVLILFVICLCLGLMVGYGVIGDGNPTDVFVKQTWQHILDFMEKE